MFCEHASVNYGPDQYSRFLEPANRLLLSRYDNVLSCVYCEAGKHLLPRYFDRGRPAWLSGCDADPPADLIRRHRGRAIVTVRTSPSEFEEAVGRFGRVGVCYLVNCSSLEEAVRFSSVLERRRTH
jgi:hypothetical protein